MEFVLNAKPCSNMTSVEKHVCRVCLKEDKMMISIFDHEGALKYCDKITQCTGIIITENDGFPSMICPTCELDLSTTCDFITRCRDSDKTLREFESNLTIKIEVKDVDDLDDDFPSDDIIKYDQDEIKVEETHGNEIESIFYVQKKKKSKKKERKKKIKLKSPETRCSLCGLKTSSRAALIVHMRRHTGERPFKCPHCDLRFAQTGTLKVHISRRHSNEPRHLRERRFSCETCGVRFFTKRDLLVHSRRHTGDHPYACELCTQRFTQLSSLIRHRRTHTGERPFNCKLCGKSFTDGSVLRNHQAVHSEERRFTCNICGKAVKSRNALNKHLDLHRNAKSIICDQCGIGFSTKGNLTLHIKKLHSEKSGTCSECGKHCADITEHMRKHTGESIYCCTVCGKSYPVKRSLSIHMNKHINADKHKCDKENCSQTFPRKFLLDFHLLKFHSDETPYSCKVCAKGYLRLSDLRKHLRVYHPNYSQTP